MADMTIKIEDVKTTEDAEAYLNQASEAYHNDPSHPSSCLMYEEHYRSRCICEDNADAELQANNF